MNFPTLLALMLATIGAPLAADRELAALQAADAQLATIAWRLQTANVALCRDVAPITGMTLHALAQYPLAMRARVARAFGIDERTAVLAVAGGSAAERAGLLPGDRIVAIDATELSAVAGLGFDQVAATEARIEAALVDARISLRVARGSALATVDIGGVPGCVSRVQLVPGDGLNAAADGRYVQIGGAMFNFAQSEDERAVVVAHELAHNVLGHRGQLDSAKVSRGLFAGLGKGGALLRRTEFEADRLGVWLMARAGYDLKAAVPFWTRLGEATGLGIFSAGTHPRWKDRIARVSEAVAEVEEQRARGAALVPPKQQPAWQPEKRR